MKTLPSRPWIPVFLLTAAIALANSAVEPEPRSGGWLQRHLEFVTTAHAGNIDVLFLGDSITDFWRLKVPNQGGWAVWNREFAPLHAANFGISGDRTQHVLWRLQNGEGDGFKPRVIVLMIGTNNTGFERDKVTPRNSPAETIEGVTAVVKELRQRFPAAKLLLLAIFPRGEKDSPQRAQVNEINQGIAKLHDGKSVQFLDIGARFLDAESNIPKDVMPDLLHPSEKGYEIWAEAIREPLQQLLR